MVAHPFRRRCHRCVQCSRMGTLRRRPSPLSLAIPPSSEFLFTFFHFRGASAITGLRATASSFCRVRRFARDERRTQRIHAAHARLLPLLSADPTPRAQQSTRGLKRRPLPRVKPFCIFLEREEYDVVSRKEVRLILFSPLSTQLHAFYDSYSVL